MFTNSLFSQGHLGQCHFQGGVPQPVSKHDLSPFVDNTHEHKETIMSPHSQRMIYNTSFWRPLLCRHLSPLTLVSNSPVLLRRTSCSSKNFTWSVFFSTCIWALLCLSDTKHNSDAVSNFHRAGDLIVEAILVQYWDYHFYFSYSWLTPSYTFGDHYSKGFGDPT